MRVIFILSFLGALSVKNGLTKEMKLEIKNRIELPEIPSASGVEFYGNKFYIIGDNSAWLYELDESLVIKRKYHIHDHIASSGDTIPKKDKPDLEAIITVPGVNESSLWIFGSGSKSPQRDVLIKAGLNNPSRVETYSLEKFYTKLKSEGIAELNIEGAVYFNKHIFLLNRAGNLLIEFSCAEFDLFLQKPELELKFKIYGFSLPVISDVQAGFSGGCLIPNTSKMIYTASLEQTDNWIDDGDILGSFVGIVDLNNLEEKNESETVPVIQNGEMLAVKIESVTVKSVLKNKVQLVLVSDSDGGSSELFEVELKY